MSSSDTSFDSSSDSKTAETEIEYDLEVEVMPNASEQKELQMMMKQAFSRRELASLI